MSYKNLEKAKYSGHFDSHPVLFDALNRKFTDRISKYVLIAIRLQWKQVFFHWRSKQNKFVIELHFILSTMLLNLEIYEQIFRQVQCNENKIAYRTPLLTYLFIVRLSLNMYKMKKNVCEYVCVCVLNAVMCIILSFLFVKFIHSNTT